MITLVREDWEGQTFTVSGCNVQSIYFIIWLWNVFSTYEIHHLLIYICRYIVPLIFLLYISEHKAHSQFIIRRLCFYKQRIRKKKIKNLNFKLRRHILKKFPNFPLPGYRMSMKPSQSSSYTHDIEMDLNSWSFSTFWDTKITHFFFLL